MVCDELRDNERAMGKGEIVKTKLVISYNVVLEMELQQC